jgi:hypothetical protein
MYATRQGYAIIVLRLMAEAREAALSSSEIAGRTGHSYNYAHQTLTVLWVLHLLNRSTIPSACIAQGEPQILWHISHLGKCLIDELAAGGA